MYDYYLFRFFVYFHLLEIIDTYNTFLSFNIKHLCLILNDSILKEMFTKDKEEYIYGYLE